MKIVIGIILVVVLIGALIAYLIFMLNARGMIYCGDVKNETAGGASVTRIYTMDFSANEALAEIVRSMDNSEGDTIDKLTLTEILAEYQDIIYAPVFSIDAVRVDNSTYIITGNVLNGLKDNGEPADPDYCYRNLHMSAVLENGMVLSAQNVYPETVAQPDKENVLIERSSVIEPLISSDAGSAVFSFRDTDSFRMIINGTNEDFYPRVSFLFTYDVAAVNPLNFTSIDNAALGVLMTVQFDENGEFDPAYEIVRTAPVEEK